MHRSAAWLFMCDHTHRIMCICMLTEKERERKREIESKNWRTKCETDNAITEKYPLIPVTTHFTHSGKIRKKSFNNRAHVQFCLGLQKTQAHLEIVLGLEL